MSRKKVLLWIKNSFCNLLGRIEDFLFPRLCIICNKPRSPQQKWFCTSCHKRLIQNHLDRVCCPRCSQNHLYRVCSCDLAWDYPFERIYSLIDFDEYVQQIMHHVKYYGKNKLAWYMGKIMTEYIPESFFDGFDIITAVPLHWSRQLSRGYNQAYWFAKGIVDDRKKPLLVTNVIKRQGRTRTQTKLDRSQRKKNMQNAFVVNRRKGNEIRGRSVILVDDVVTTGATTSACAEELLKNGCSKVNVLSLARD